MPGAAPGDQVVLMGTDGSETITAEDLSRWSGTISYTSGRYYSIVCGDNIITWLMPVSLSSSYNALASDAFTSSKTHYIYSHTAAPTSAQSEHAFRNSATAQPSPMLWIRSNVTTGTQAATFSPN